MTDRQVPISSVNVTRQAEELRLLFRHTFMGARPGEVLDLGPLQHHVCAYVRSAKARGEMPERIIGELKQMLSSEMRSDASSALQRRVRDALIRWCLDEYFQRPATSLGDAEPARPVPGTRARERDDETREGR